jgi:hypothetical protein
MGTHKEHDGNKAKKKKNSSHPSSLKRKKMDPSLPYAEPFIGCMQFLDTYSASY